MGFLTSAELAPLITLMEMTLLLETSSWRTILLGTLHEYVGINTTVTVTGL